jgi:hypothetical protein
LEREPDNDDELRSDLNEASMKRYQELVQ